MKFSKHIKYLFIKLALFITIAVLIIVFREQLIEYIDHFIGTLMVVYGIEELLSEILFAGKLLLTKDKFYLGIIDILLGVVLIFTKLSYEATCVIWAAWSIIRESFEIKDIFAELHVLIPRIVYGIESVVVIVFSIMLIAEPGEHHAMIHLYLLLAELTLNPLIPLIDEIVCERREQKEENKTED